MTNDDTGIIMIVCCGSNENSTIMMDNHNMGNICCNTIPHCRKVRYHRVEWICCMGSMTIRGNDNDDDDDTTVVVAVISVVDDDDDDHDGGRMRYCLFRCTNCA